MKKVQHTPTPRPDDWVFAVTEGSVNFVIAPTSHTTASSFDDSDWSKLDCFLTYTCLVTWKIWSEKFQMKNLKWKILSVKYWKVKYKKVYISLFFYIIFTKSLKQIYQTTVFHRQDELKLQNTAHFNLLLVFLFCWTDSHNASCWNLIIQLVCTNLF